MKYDLDKIKKISIEDWLDKNGYKKARGSGKYVSYYSPFGSEKAASFKLNTVKNTFHCYHSGKGGDIISLVMEIEGCVFQDACRILDGGDHVEIHHFEPKVEKSGVDVHSVNEITDKELIHYMTNIRCIDYDVLIRHCKELVISFPMGRSPERTYNVIAMQNSMKGWECRNNFIKIATRPKAFTKVRGLSSDKLILIEGYTDWLSYATLHKIDVPDYDVFILNGLGQLNLLKPFFQDKEILFMLDNDIPADNALESLKEYNVIDRRMDFPFSKDINSYLCGLKLD